MALLSFLKSLFSKKETLVSETQVAPPVVTPDPVVVDTETASEVGTIEKKKRAPKAEKQITIEKKTIQKKAKK
jgi:hypothetical protein